MKTEGKNVIEYPVKPAAISLLDQIRKSFMDDDGEISLKVAGCGRYFAGDMIADTISAILRTEQQCYKTISALEANLQENCAYKALLGGRYVEEPTYEQRKELSELVAKWGNRGSGME